MTQQLNCHRNIGDCHKNLLAMRQHRVQRKS